MVIDAQERGGGSSASELSPAICATACATADERGPMSLDCGELPGASAAGTATQHLPSSLIGGWSG